MPKLFLSKTTRQQYHDDLIMVCPDMGDGGTQRVVSTMANIWAKQGKSICVVTTRSRADFYKLDPSIRRVRINGTAKVSSNNLVNKNNKISLKNRLKYSIKSGLIIVRKGVTFILSLPLLKKISPSVESFLLITEKLIATASTNFALRRTFKSSDAPTIIAFLTPSNISTIIASYGLDKQIIISERNNSKAQEAVKSLDILRTKLYKHADLVTANSLGEVENLSAYVPKEKLAYLPNPLRQPIPETINPVVNRTPVLLNVARIMEAKAQDILLKAFAKCEAELPEWSIAIAGRGDKQEALQQLAQELKIEDKVKWLGQVEDPYAHYQEAGIFVLPSKYEGMSNSLLEAMSYGIPVIVSDSSPGMMELVDHDKSGIIFATDNVDQLASAIVKLAKAPNLRQKIADAALKRAAMHEMDQVLPIWNKIVRFTNTNL